MTVFVVAVIAVVASRPSGCVIGVMVATWK